MRPELSRSDPTPKEFQIGSAWLDHHRAEPAAAAEEGQEVEGPPLRDRVGRHGNAPRPHVPTASPERQFVHGIEHYVEPRAEVIDPLRIIRESLRSEGFDEPRIP